MTHTPCTVRNLILTMTLLCFAGAPAMAADAAKFHHVHLTASDTKQASHWYADHFGGEAKPGFFNTTVFDKVTFIYFLSKPGFPGSAGSVVDHIGFSVKDVAAKLKQLEAAGVKVVSGVEQEGSIKFAMVEDPWGTRIELLEDPQIEGFHHVHLATVDPEKSLAWYTKAFGGEITRFAGVTPGIRYGDVWLLAKKVEQAPAATKGRSIDHISWGFPDLDAAAVELKAKDVPFKTNPTQFGTSKIAFVEDPTGVLIELVGPGKKK